MSDSRLSIPDRRSKRCLSSSGRPCRHLAVSCWSVACYHVLKSRHLDSLLRLGFKSGWLFRLPSPVSRTPTQGSTVEPTPAGRSSDDSRVPTLVESRNRDGPAGVASTLPAPNAGGARRGHPSVSLYRWNTTSSPRSEQTVSRDDGRPLGPFCLALHVAGLIRAG